uniref:2-C-methyl-D-erythritol 2,4-cyclodiphosphate synthase n=1 Tax=candidate division WOR-3 bacterium TaxID=2052148 RepID=A0A7C6EBA9_UNCW3
MESNWRIGIGFDSHPFAKNRRLILGGVVIPFPKGLFGHSDADCLCHSIADAILGACGQKDIGNYFPDTDERYKDISSLKILASVVKMMKKKGYRIANIDTTLILKQPKISPYVEKMKDTLAKVLKINRNCIGIKAKTTEALGFAKLKSGIACYAVALLVKR